MNVKKLTELSLLTTIALIIFVIELQLPNFIAIPGVKLGLANIITVYAVYNYKGKEVMMIVISRIILGSIFSGNIISLLYSLAGGTLCLLAMLFFKHFILPKYLWLSSVFGALFHNIGQIVMACLILGNKMIVYLPFLLVSGCIAGVITGICAQLIINYLKDRKVLYD
ncbi:Gx transporter family protein [Thomasclavelia sp.]|uniref:Gx transporter family protein n=1 Tax=Thomasclavelia sp. TaxID=3025757 RepID=UPI0025FB3112|nr:Gx transporter family protein [Thomasclavelia sp.]